MAEQNREMLQEAINAVSQKADICQKEGDKSEKVKNSLLQQTVQNENQITNKLEDLQNLLQSHANCPLQQLENGKRKAGKEIEQNKQDNNRETLILESFIRYSQEVKDKATSADMCRVADDLHARARQLQDMKLTSILPSPFISFSPSDAVEELMKHQNVVGSIYIGPGEVMTTAGLLTQNNCL